jgi:hypothetical protein
MAEVRHFLFLFFLFFLCVCVFPQGGVGAMLGGCEGRRQLQEWRAVHRYEHARANL